MVVDAHVHLAMHLRPRGGDRIRDALASRDGRFRLLERVDNWALTAAEHIWNHRSLLAGPRVTVLLLREGNVNVALSVLHLPFYEVDLIGLVEPRYGQPCSDECFKGLIRQLVAVEKHVEGRYGIDAAVAHNWDELESALARGKLAIIHCVEGAFHLGSTVGSVERNISQLARLGIAYITLAHLFWRGFATNVPALPLLSDGGYRRLFPQPPTGLTVLGRAAIRTMVRERVLIDLTHMSAAALADTFSLLDELDPDRSVPVVASHAAYRFGRHAYSLDGPTVRRIADRGGLIGVIVGERPASDNLRAGATASLAGSLDVLCHHIDKLAEIAGSFEHVAIGSDLGVIKPLAGLEDASCPAALGDGLRARYGQSDAQRVLGGNMLDLLRSYWGQRDEVQMT